jgi:predicted ATPase
MRAVAQTYLSWDLFILGCPGQAASQSEQAIAWSRSLHHPHTLAFSLNYAALVHQLARSERSHRAFLDELILVATEHRFPQWLACADVMRGYALGVRGETAEGLALIGKGLAEHSAMGASWNQPYYLALLALTNDRAGRTDEAIGLLDTAIEIVERTGERWFEAELRRLQGEWHVAHRQDVCVKAEASFRRAIDVAQNQQAKMWELRASTSLARLWRDQGKRTEARDLLAPIYGWFTEGFDTLDLKEAKALLEDLT